MKPIPFITFEGVEACGKTTQIELLKKHLEQTRTVCVVREPGGTAIGEAIRLIFKDPDKGEMVPETELLLLAAARAQLVREVIKPQLLAGNVVISDRYVDSTMAYQCYGRLMEAGMIRKLEAFAVETVIPFVTFFLDVSLAHSHQRMAKRGDSKDRMERNDGSFFERVRHGYKMLALANPQRIVTIDGALPIDCVEASIWNYVRSLRDSE